MAGKQSERAEAQFFVTQVRAGRMSAAAARECLGFTESERRTAEHFFNEPARAAFSFREKALAQFEQLVRRGGTQ